MSLYRSFINNNLLVIMAHVLVYAQGLIVMPLVIKTVGATVYGGYVLVTSLVGIIFGISSLGVGFRRSRFLPSAPDRESRQQLFYPQLFFQFLSLVILSLALILVYPYFNIYFLKSEVIFSAWLVVPYLLCYLFYVQTIDYFRYTNRMGSLTSATIVYHCIYIAIIFLIYFVTHEFTVNTLFAVTIFASLAVAIPLAFKVVEQIGFRCLFPKIRDLIQDMKLGLPLVLHYVADTILGISDRYLIAAFMTVTAVGYYSPGYTLGSLMVFFPKVSGVVLPPLLAKAVDGGNHVEARTMVNYTLKAFLLLAIPFVVGSALLSKPLLTLLGNAEVARNAYLVTPIVALGVLFYGLNIILSNVLFVLLKTTTIFKMNAIAGLLNLSLNFIFFTFFKNIVVAAITTLVSYFIVFLLIRRTLADWPVDYEPGTIFKSLAASLAMGAILYWMSILLGSRSFKLIFILSQVAVGIAVYCLALLALKTFSREELLYLKRAFSLGES